MLHLSFIPKYLPLATLLTSSFLLPGKARAQFAFAPGHYKLATGAQGDADLKLVLAEDNRPGAMAGVRNGQERSFRLAQVAAFSVDGHSFARQDGFKLRAGFDAQFTDPVLLETVVVDGPIELFHYYYVAPMGPLKAHITLAVLRKKGTNNFFVYSPKHAPGLNAQQALSPLVAGLFPADPILQRQLVSNQVTRVQLPDLVRAYNKGVRLKP
ncbi:hypothetical protein [Hymenobacter coccineus]|uniref:hypothetical protein n=1 Tax=Hymenobacter coccineus TaxID=1908235 RepID=UPI000AE7CD56|nr:hypothetical protein [Hymenobacter coccineus]